MKTQLFCGIGSVCPVTQVQVLQASESCTGKRERSPRSRAFKSCLASSETQQFKLRDVQETCEATGPEVRPQEVLGKGKAPQLAALAQWFKSLHGNVADVLTLEADLDQSKLRSSRRLQAKGI